MQFLKKNYEKVLLGLVLVGLVVSVGFLVVLVSKEKEAQEERRTKIFNRPVKPIEAADTTALEALLAKADSPLALDLSSSNKVFNPVRWQKDANGKPLRNPAGSELRNLQVVKISPLYFVLTLDSVSVSDSGVRYVLGLDQQSKARAGKRQYYVSKGDKKDLFSVVEVRGPAENPTALVLELTDSGERVSIAKEHPFRRVDGYMADLKYPPENRSFLARRTGATLSFGGSEYNLVAITEDEVVLSAPSGKKTSIKSLAGLETR